MRTSSRGWLAASSHGHSIYLTASPGARVATGIVSRTAQPASAFAAERSQAPVEI